MMDIKDRLNALVFSSKNNQLDYYDGGMELSLKSNKLTYKSIQTLTKLLEKIDGFKSLDISHQKSPLSKAWLTQRKDEKQKIQFK